MKVLSHTVSEWADS